MEENKEQESQEDEVILTVRFSRLLAWVGPIYGVLFACICLYYFPITIARREYIGIFLMPAAALIFLVYAVDALFTKSIQFYEDRVVKIWHFFGKRTISYSKGQLVLPNVPGAKGYRVKEINTKGRPSVFQIPILYNARFVTPKTAKQVDAIMNFLGGDTDRNRNPRPFVKHALPKEVIQLPEERKASSIFSPSFMAGGGDDPDHRA